MKNTFCKKLNSINPEYLLIGSITLFMILSFALLSFIEMNQHSQHAGWSLSFTDPKSSVTSFTITNYTQDTSFHYAVLRGDKEIQSGDLVILPEQQQSTTIDELNVFEEEISVIVQTQNDQKEILK